MRIGFTEIMVILIVALLVLGPDKLPYYARKLGEGLKEFRKVSSEATKDIRECVIEPLEEAQRPLREAMEPITELEKDVRENVKGIKRSFTDLGKADMKKPDPGSSQASPESEKPEESVPSSTGQDAEDTEAEPKDGEGAKTENT